MSSTRAARDCDPNVARKVLRAYLGDLSRCGRMALLRRTAAAGLTIPLTGDDGAIVFTHWEALAIAGDLL